jgi:hypothetical protein
MNFHAYSWNGIFTHGGDIKMKMMPALCKQARCTAFFKIRPSALTATHGGRQCQ